MYNVILEAITKNIMQKVFLKCKFGELRGRGTEGKPVASQRQTLFTENRPAATGAAAPSHLSSGAQRLGWDGASAASLVPCINLGAMSLCNLKRDGPPTASAPSLSRGEDRHSCLLHSSPMFSGIITLETKFREGEWRTTRERRKMVPETGLKGRNYSSYRMSLRISLWVLRATFK